MSRKLVTENKNTEMVSEVKDINKLLTTFSEYLMKSKLEKKTEELYRLLCQVNELVENNPEQMSNQQKQQAYFDLIIAIDLVLKQVCLSKNSMVSEKKSKKTFKLVDKEIIALGSKLLKIIELACPNNFIFKWLTLQRLFGHYELCNTTETQAEKEKIANALQKIWFSQYQDKNLFPLFLENILELTKKNPEKNLTFLNQMIGERELKMVKELDDNKMSPRYHHSLLQDIQQTLGKHAQLSGPLKKYFSQLGKSKESPLPTYYSFHNLLLELKTILAETKSFSTKSIVFITWSDNLKPAFDSLWSKITSNSLPMFTKIEISSIQHIRKNFKFIQTFIENPYPKFNENDVKELNLLADLLLVFTDSLIFFELPRNTLSSILESKIIDKFIFFIEMHSQIKKTHESQKTHLREFLLNQILWVKRMITQMNPIPTQLKELAPAYEIFLDTICETDYSSHAIALFDWTVVLITLMRKNTHEDPDFKESLLKMKERIVIFENITKESALDFMYKKSLGRFLELLKGIDICPKNSDSNSMRRMADFALRTIEEEKQKRIESTLPLDYKTVNSNDATLNPLTQEKGETKNSSNPNETENTSSVKVKKKKKPKKNRKKLQQHSSENLSQKQTSGESNQQNHPVIITHQPDKKSENLPLISTISASTSASPVVPLQQLTTEKKEATTNSTNHVTEKKAKNIKDEKESPKQTQEKSKQQKQLVNITHQPNKNSENLTTPIISASDSSTSARPVAPSQLAKSSANKDGDAENDKKKEPQKKEQELRQHSKEKESKKQTSGGSSQQNQPVNVSHQLNKNPANLTISTVSESNSSTLARLVVLSQLAKNSANKGDNDEKKKTPQNGEELWQTVRKKKNRAQTPEKSNQQNKNGNAIYPRTFNTSLTSTTSGRESKTSTQSTTSTSFFQPVRPEFSYSLILRGTKKAEKEEQQQIENHQQQTLLEGKNHQTVNNTNQSQNQNKLKIKPKNQSSASSSNSNMPSRKSNSVISKPQTTDQRISEMHKTEENSIIGNIPNTTNPIISSMTASVSSTSTSFVAPLPPLASTHNPKSQGSGPPGFIEKPEVKDSQVASNSQSETKGELKPTQRVNDQSNIRSSLLQPLTHSEDQKHFNVDVRPKSDGLLINQSIPPKQTNRMTSSFAKEVAKRTSSVGFTPKLSDQNVQTQFAYSNNSQFEILSASLKNLEKEMLEKEKKWEIEKNEQSKEINELKKALRSQQQQDITNRNQDLKEEGYSNQHYYPENSRATAELSYQNSLNNTLPGTTVNQDGESDAYIEEEEQENPTQYYPPAQVYSGNTMLPYSPQPGLLYVEHRIQGQPPIIYTELPSFYQLPDGSFVPAPKQNFVAPIPNIPVAPPTTGTTLISQSLAPTVWGRPPHPRTPTQQTQNHSTSTSGTYNHHHR